MERNDDIRLILLAFLMGRGELDDPVTEKFLIKILRDRNFSKSGDLDYFLEELLLKKREYSRKRLEVEELTIQTQDYIRKLEHDVSRFQNELSVLEKKMEELSYNNKSLISKTDNSSDELHEFIWRNSLGVKAEKAKIERFIPVKIYLPDSPDNFQITESIKRLRSTDKCN